MGKTYKQVLALVFITIILSGLRFLSLDDGFTLIKKNKNVVSNGIVSTSFETRLKTIIKTEYSEPQIIEIQFAKYLYDNQSAIFIDSRDSIEFNDRHIKNAINISYEDEYCSSIEDLNKSEIFVIYCSGFECDLSLELAEYLVYDEDFKKILVFEEGLQGWLENEFPTENGEIIRYPETNSYKNYIMIILYSLIIFIGLIYFYFPRLRNKGFHLNKFTIQICRLVLG
ncbi:MAG: rhodanese-like domain-containing protein, partial [Candidatus Marinimicrobia bacterium]|nr:rhodanese-like domain-containing protein [Candidatus Neomarinimicrobiota bacterium]